MPTQRSASWLVAGLLFTLVLQSCVSPEDPSVSDDEQAVAPPAPTNLTVVNVAGGFTTRQDLSWTPSAGATKYVIYRGTGGTGSETTYTSCCASGPPFVANHLTAATNYCWQVRAA